MPDPMILDCRDVAFGAGPARAGIMRGGLTFEQLGTDILRGGGDPSQDLGYAPIKPMIRHMGQVWCGTMDTPNTCSVRPYDEGGTDDWHDVATDQTAKGGAGANFPNSSRCQPHLIEVLTADRPYLVAVYANVSNLGNFSRYNPDTNAWDTFTSSLTLSVQNSLDLIAHDGLVFAVRNDGGTVLNSISSFDPASGGIVNYPVPTYTASSGGLQKRGLFFTLHDRLFLATMDTANVFGENTYTSRVLEFAFGLWTDVGVDLNFGDAVTGGLMAVFRISPTKVLIIGHGSGRDPDGGLIANVLSTVGDVKSAALQNAPGTLATTNAVIPLLLRPTTAGYGSGGGAAPQSARCYGYTFTDDPTGQIRHFLFYHPDGALASATVTTIFEVFDENTPMAVINQTPQSDSDFAFSTNFYGGGARNGGVDGTTRYVSVQARGFTGGNNGIRLNVSAHGDATVVAHRGIAGGPFTVGELITGGTSGATGILIGDGAAEGLYLRGVIGAFVQDEVVTGGTSGATATVNGVLNHGPITGALFQVLETVTGGTSGATAPVTHLGLGGAGETLVKVGAVAGGPFVNGETITGGTSLAVATLSSAPLGSHGGAADKTIRARFFNQTGPSGKGVPDGFCTMVLGTGVGGLVVKNVAQVGGGFADEFQSVIADGAPGDVVRSFEWDFLADGVSQGLATQVIYEADRT